MKMYRVKPLYDFQPDIALPTCMYKMQNMFDKPESGAFNENDVKLLEMEKHQLNIIQKLEDLKEKVLKMKEDLGVSIEKDLPRFQDIVIKANPQYPPLSMWVFYHLLSKSISTRLVTYLHSSLRSVPENIRLLQNITNSEQCKISLTIIWRNGDQDHEMMIDPIHQGIIEGEVNIARYISRLLSSNYDADPILATEIDNWLEVVHSSVIHGNIKERQGVLRSLNSHFGKCNFLVGDSMTVADIMMCSAIIQTKLHQSLSSNSVKWFKNLMNSEMFHMCKELACL